MFFYVIPENEEVHLPTDLLGMNPGKYNSKRFDGNLHAALGSFTNQVRSELKKFVYINLKELDGESENAKKLVIDRPFAFEHLLLAELLETRLASINKKYNDLKKGLIFIRSKKVTGQEYVNFFLETLTDFKRFAQILESLYTCEIKVALGPDGVQAKYSDLKDISDKFLFLCNELIDWEMRNQQLDAPDELSLVKGLIKGWSEIFLSEINTVPGQIRGLVELYQDPNRDKTDVKITLKLEGIKNTEELMSSFQEFFNKKR